MGFNVPACYSEEGLNGDDAVFRSNPCDHNFPKATPL